MAHLRPYLSLCDCVSAIVSGKTAMRINFKTESGTLKTCFTGYRLQTFLWNLYTFPSFSSTKPQLGYKRRPSTCNTYYCSSNVNFLHRKIYILQLFGCTGTVHHPNSNLFLIDKTEIQKNITGGEQCFLVKFWVLIQLIILMTCFYNDLMRYMFVVKVKLIKLHAKTNLLAMWHSVFYCKTQKCFIQWVSELKFLSCKEVISTVKPSLWAAQLKPNICGHVLAHSFINSHTGVSELSRWTFPIWFPNAQTKWRRANRPRD